MKKSQLSVVERTKAFVDWLSPQVSSKQLRDFFLITSAIDDYGKQHKQFKESMFELDDPERAQQFRKMIQNDKRFLFVHYGKSRAILLWLQKYCEFLQLQSEGEPEEPKSIPSVSVSQEQKPATLVKKSGSVVLRTKSGSTYYGDSCAEVLASFCEYLAKKYPKALQRVIGEQYYGQGSVVLYAAEPAGGGIKVNQGNCYVDISLGKSAVEYYAKWLCKMCGELDLPVSLTVSEKKSEAEGQKQQAVVNPEKAEAKKAAAPAEKQEVAAKPAAPLWRDQAQSAVAAVPAKREEAVKPVAASPSGLDADLEALLAGKEYAQLRDELVSQKVTSLAQFKALDLWSFMNWAGLYSIGRRQEICKQIKTMLDAMEKKEDGKQYCLKTVKGNCYYGSSPAKALASLYDSIALRSPLTIRKLIGQRYNGIGMVVLYPDMPKTGGIQLTNPVAYLEKNLSERVALYYGIWICRKCSELDEPVSLTEVGKKGTVDESTTKQPKPQEKPPVMVEEQEDDTTGEDWLFKMLADQGIQYEDKRDNQGCLWIYGGHELDQFIKLCVKKGYRFFYKADGYKAFKNGPAWWTVNRGAKPVKEIPDNPDKQKTKPVSGQGKISLRDMIATVLNESKRPMSAAEIVTEIKKKPFFKFSSGNPNMMVDYEIRKHCAGVYASGHVPDSECIFGQKNNGKGIAQYYLLEWGMLCPEGESKELETEKYEKKAVASAHNRWEVILSRYFPDGYIPDDFLSQLQAKAYWQEEYGEECTLDGAEIDAEIKSAGTVRDGRVFVRSDEENDLISAICAEISMLLDEYTSVYRNCIYERYQDKLAQFSIFTESVMEEQLLEKANGSFYCAWQIFMRKGRESSVTLDCRKVLRNHGGAMHVSDVQKVLWFIPGDTVYHTLSVDKEALNIGNSVWMLAEHFPLIPEEAARIGDVLDEFFISNNYIQAENMLPLLREKLPSVAEYLQGLHFTAIFNIIRYYLEDRFTFTKAIVAPKGSKKIDFTVLYHDFAAQREHFTLDELTAFAKEMKNPIYWESVFSGGAVRVSKYELVQKSNVKFDVAETDKVLEDICPGDYMPFYAVSPAMMMHLPPCGYQWNGYLLLNYVYSFSKIFRASYKSIGKTGYYGAMVRKDCRAIGNYNQLLVRFLTDDDTWKTVDDACELIVKKGFQAAKDIGGIEKIVSQAKLNKLKKGE